MRESLERALFHWKKASNSLISQRQMILNQPESLHPSMPKKCQDSATLGFGSEVQVPEPLTRSKASPNRRPLYYPAEDHLPEPFALNAKQLNRILVTCTVATNLGLGDASDRLYPVSFPAAGRGVVRYFQLNHKRLKPTLLQPVHLNPNPKMRIRIPEPLKCQSPKPQNPQPHKPETLN